MLKSRGIIRQTIVDDGKLWVSFPAHDGYFYVQDRDLRKQILKAEREHREISFNFDSTLKILSLH